MELSTSHFGDYSLFSLCSSKGEFVELIPYGASIFKIGTKDKNGNIENIVLSLESPEDYKFNDSYAGATMTPCAGRIKDAELPLPDGKKRTLSVNDCNNNMHGGAGGGSFKLWNVESHFCEGNRAGVTFSLPMEDGTDGFPGNRIFYTEYIFEEFNDKSSLTMHYTSISDEVTWVGPSNHSYFNLSADFSKPAYDQLIYIDADMYLENRPDCIPLGFKPVNDTHFDFRKARSPKRELLTHSIFDASNGYDHAFDTQNAVNEKASLTDKTNGRRVRFFSDYPSVVFYAGGMFDENTRLSGGIGGSPWCAFAFELQEFPDAVHLDVPLAYLMPGDERKRFIQFVFDTV